MKLWEVLIQKEAEKWEKKEQMEQIKKSKMIDLNPTLSVIIVAINT